MHIFLIIDNFFSCLKKDSKVLAVEMDILIMGCRILDLRRNEQVKKKKLDRRDWFIK